MEGDLLPHHNSMVAYYFGLTSFVEGLERFVCTTIDNLDQIGKKDIYLDFANFVIDLRQNVMSLDFMRDSRNAPRTSRLPPERPAELLRLTPREFYALIEKERDRLSTTFSAKQVDGIKDDFLRLRKELLGQVKAVPRGLDFEASWKPFGQWFKLLRSICGGLASVYSETATLESDFSIFNYEVRSHWVQLSNLSSSGILHPKQYEEIRRMHYTV